MDVEKDFEEFVEQLVQGLGEHLDQQEIQRSEDGNLLLVRSCQANLRSLFRTYAAAPEQGVHHLVSSVLDVLNRTQSDESSLEWDDVQTKLRPKLWDRMVMGDNGTNMPFKLMGEHLMLSIVIDQEHSMQSVPRSLMESWGVTLDEALEVAFANIAPKTQLMGVSAPDESSGHCSTATHDCYDSTRFLLEQPYEMFHIGYPRFAFPSARDMCVMANADRIDDLEFNVELALEFGDSDPKPLPPFPLVNSGDGWRNWFAPPGSALERLLARRQFAFFFNGYTQQTRQLQEHLQEAGDFVLVESYRKWPDSSDELPKSYSSWPANTETLLPKTDYILFPDHQNKCVAWDDVVAVCPTRLMPAEAVYPPRWRTEGDPTDAELARMRAS